MLELLGSGGFVQEVVSTVQGLALLIIEVKYNLTDGKEYLDAVAQIIVEVDGTNLPPSMNLIDYC